ncbi:hypothetical protein [Natronorarus salvus]|uniref:hypothetical protein n=1 Tax=Natronorarus salvus TaxID=3117733 RepID=UPI002F26744F
MDPIDIDYIKLIPPNAFPLFGSDAVRGAAGGPWDRFKMSFSRHYVYRSIETVLKNDSAWDETPLFAKSDDQQRFESRCSEIEELIESIHNHGYQSELYRSESPLNDGRHEIGSATIPDEIIVGMDRKGRLIHLRGGRHRLAISQVLGIEEIPVVLSLYHPQATKKIPEPIRSIPT